MSFVNKVTAVIGKFNESTDHDPAIEGRFEALEASAME
jgi:hypothetical protein